MYICYKGLDTTNPVFIICSQKIYVFSHYIFIIYSQKEINQILRSVFLGDKASAFSSQGVGLDLVSLGQIIVPTPVS